MMFLVMFKLMPFCSLFCSKDARIGSVKDMSCIGREACQGSKIGNLSDNSCFGDLSCQRAKITSATRSCYGNNTCHHFVVNGSLANSCRDPWMCIAQDHQGDLDDYCRGPLESPFPPPCSRGTVQYARTTLLMVAMVSMKLLFG